MRELPLYTEIPATILETIEPLDVERDGQGKCTRCAFHERAQNICISGFGEPGGLFVVGEAPGRNEDLRGMPFIGASGGELRKLIKRWWRGPVVLDNAVRCYPGKNADVGSSAIDACRPFLAGSLREVQPTRILTVGAVAAFSVLGRTTAPFSTRRGYSFLRGFGKPIPVFMVLHPAAALRNRFVRKWFEDDMEWALTSDPEYPPWDSYLRLVTTRREALAAVDDLRRAEWSSFDVESAGLLFSKSFRMLCLSLCAKGSRDPYLWTKGALADAGPRDVLIDFLCDERAKKVGANVKFDMIASFLWSRGRMPAGIEHDVRLARKLIEPEAEAKLERMAELVGMGGMKHENREAKESAAARVNAVLSFERRTKKQAARQAAGLKFQKVSPPKGPKTLRECGVDALLEEVVRAEKPAKDGKHKPAHAVESWVYALVPDDVLYRYNARDTVATTALGEKLVDQLEKHPSLDRIYKKVVMPAQRAIAQVEAWGVAVDRDAIESFDQYLAMELADVNAVLDGFKRGINWDSTPQLREYLFRELGLPVIKLTETEAESTDKEVLKELEQEHPVIPALIRMRYLNKLKGTYAAGMLPHVRDDGRIHPTILLDGARSGRTSCQDPNLQNLPRADDDEKPEAKMVRNNFTASSRNHRLVQLDYSQLELRIAAMLSGDRKMIEVFKSGHDFHMRTAQMVSKVAWGIPSEKVEKKHRSVAKTFNFGMLYGKTDSSFAKELHCTKGEASAIRAAILGEFNQLDAWTKERLNEAKRTGKVWTYWEGKPARWRPLWRIADQDEGQRITAENGAVNSPVQGTASEYCVASLAALVQWILEDAVPAKLVLAVHDSLLFDVERSAVGEVAHYAREVMQSWFSGDVPLIVDVEEGDQWGMLSKMAA